MQDITLPVEENSHNMMQKHLHKVIPSSIDCVCNQRMHMISHCAEIVKSKASGSLISLELWIEILEIPVSEKQGRAVGLIPQDQETPDGHS